ncbi:bifunctional folylpolyglutamate synthase/dihydrofolate synthase [Candidatus Woesearchaeota archaeon]|nr:bifunctional folylpolyglutamate synthase/dihydrofolate synthase [Candidatus Woesearchaeota archaeon]
MIKELEEMYSLDPLEIKLGLERMHEVLEKFGNPQKKLKVIHVAGTNGKGSVCAMLQSILSHAGKKTGCYTSPHILEFNERITIKYQKIKDQDIAKLFNEIKKTGVRLTFFEVSTVLAILHFAEQEVDYAIFEVGLGGRLDATNVFDSPRVTVITNIDLDHTEFLGKTRSEISKEKAGILRKGVPLFTSETNLIIQDLCDDLGSPFVLCTPYNGEISLKGKYQKRNAGIAVQVAKYLGIDYNAIIAGIADAKWPGRLEYIEPNVLIDAAHNPAGMIELKQHLEQIKFRKLNIIFGASNSKDTSSMIKQIPECDNLIFTKSNVMKPADPHNFRKVRDDGIVIEDCAEAYKHARKLTKENDLLVICGSIYLLGEILKQIKINK